MEPWHSRTKSWLSSEQLEHDASAEKAFAEVFAALPVIDPSEDFVRRAVEAAWSVRAGRQRATAHAAIAASALVTAAGGAVAYDVAHGTPGWAGALLAAAATTSTESLTMAVVAAVEWWAVMAHAGGVVVGVISVPQNAIGLLAMELLGGGAAYALHRLLRSEPRLWRPWTLC
jgi:hypothetical protein